MNVFKKIVAGAALFSVAVVSTATGVSAYTNAQLDAANGLAGMGVIVDHANDPMAYNMDQTVLRQEIAAVARGIYEVDNGMAVNSAKADTCTNAFADVSATNPNTWACYTVEGLLNADVIAGNTNFRPEENITKSEALGMVVEATCNDYAYDASSSMTWQAQLGAYATAKGIATFSDYNTAATRGFTFEAGVNAMNACNNSNDDTDDLLDDLLDDLDDTTDDNTDDTTDDSTDDSTTTPVTGGTVEVTLSPETAASATIPGGVNGLPVVSFDFTAGDSDVTISQVTLKRTGLSDGDTIESIAAFTDMGRASNEKNDNQENDTEAQLNLSGGGVVVMAGQTRTITFVVDIPTIASNGSIEADEFALELVEVQASADVEVAGDLKGNTMRIGSVDAPTITFDNGGSVSNPQLGEDGADIFEFEIKGADDEDVVVKAITFEGDSNAEDDLTNFELYLGNDLVASTASMNDDYLTFDLGDGITIEEDKTEDFTVKADIVEGANDTIRFRVDQALDVTAESTKFGFGAAVDIDLADAFGELGSITIEAGELTLVEIDAEFDEIREDKENVVLGGIKVTNVAGENLELEEFGVKITLTPGTAALGTNVAGTLTVQELFEDIELYNVDTGSSYELSLDSTASTIEVASENSIDVVLEQGTTEWQIRADTADDITNFDSASFELSFVTGSIGTNGGFKVVEQDDNTTLTDITPSSITFNSIDGSESGAKISAVPLSNTDVVRGADDIVALQFEVEAEESSDIILDEITVRVTQTGSSAATNQQISEVKIYQGSVSDANLLDAESGSNISSTGDVTFDDIGDIIIDANGTEEFVVTISIVDGADAVTGSDYNVTILAATSLDIEDDENDDITATGTFPVDSTRDITVNNAGTIATLTFDTANEDNEFDKLALAGDETVIASYDVRADNEEVDVETVTFTLSGSALASLKNTVVNATLLLDGEEIETNTNGDIDASGTIVFDDMTDLIIPTTTSELALRLNTANIGEDFVGVAQTLQVTDVVFSNAEGVESGKDLSSNDANPSLGAVADSKTLDIVTAVVTPAVASTFGTDDQTAELQLVVDGGDNTDTNGNAVQAELAELKIELSSVTATGTIEVFNGNGTSIGSSSTVTSGVVTINVTDDSIGNDNETYRIESTFEASHRLAKDGVVYTINGGGTTTSTKLENTLELGQYANSN